MTRDPRSDPAPGDRLSLGGALARVVVAVDGARVVWTLEARGPEHGDGGLDRLRSDDLRPTPEVPGLGDALGLLLNGRVRSCSLEHWRRTFRAPLPMPSPDALDGWDRRAAERVGGTRY